MVIERVVKNVDQNGYVIEAYVIFDRNGIKYKRQIFDEREFLYYKDLYDKQQKRIKRLSSINKEANYTPAASYTPRQYKYNLPEVNTKGLNIGKPIITILTAVAITAGSIAGVNYVLCKDNKNFTVIDRIQEPGLFQVSKEDRFIVRNEVRFVKAMQSLTSDYTSDEEFDAEFIRDYVYSCYAANTNGIKNKNNDTSKYKLDLKQYMSPHDAIEYEKNGGYEYARLINKLSFRDLENSSLDYSKELKNYLDKVLSYMLQHLNPSDDEFTKLDPYTRIVMCEEVKSMLEIADPDYSFFNHAFPKRNQTRDELIEAVDKKEEAALYWLRVQVNNKQAGPVRK